MAKEIAAPSVKPFVAERVEPSTSMSERDDYDTVTIFGSSLILVVAESYYLARIGLGFHVAPVWRTAGAGLFLISVPGALARFSGPSGSSSTQARPSLHAWLTVATLLTLAALGWATRVFEFDLALPVALVGVLALAITAMRWSWPKGKLSLTLLVAVVALFSAWIVAVAWGWNDHLHPLALETLLTGGKVNPDTLFHASIASMMDTYGTPSTGLNGVPYLAYHYGSHWLLVQFGYLVGVDPFDAYQLVYPTVFVPLLLVSLLRFALDLRPMFVSKARWRPLLADWVFWAVLAAIVIGILPALWVEEISSSYRQPIVSESYNIGLSVSLLFGSALVWFWTHDAKDGERGNWQKTILLWTTLAGLTTALGFLKISLMALVVVALLYLFIRTELFRKPRYLVAMVLVVLSALVSYRITSVGNGGSVGGFLSLRDQAGQLLYLTKNFVLPVHLAWTILFVVIRVYQTGVTSWHQLFENVRHRKLLDVEVLLVVAIFGMGPLVMLDTGNNGYFFSDAQRWMAAAMLLGMVNLAYHAQLPKWIRLAKQPAAALPLIALSASMATAVILNIALPALHAVRRTVEVREAIANSKSFSDPAVQFLVNLRSRPRSERANTLLYIPRTVTGFWDRPQTLCWARPFIAPALSGIALIDGLPTAPCKQTLFGYPTYSEANRSEKRPDLTSIEICSRADQLGFQHIVIAVADNSGNLSPFDLRCPPTKSSSSTKGPRSAESA